MSTRPWALELDKPTRAHLFWCVDHRSEIEAWREILAQNERARLINHPTAMKRRYETAHATQERDLKTAPTETRSQLRT
jgi:hypothetical protein